MFNKNKLYNKNIEKIGKMISIESKINVVGSASIKRSLYYQIMIYLNTLMINLNQ